MIMMQHNVVSGVLYISDMLRTKSTPRSPMEEGEPTMNHKPPYQEASGIVVPKSVISYPYSPSRYFQSLFSIVALISINWFRVPSRHVRPLVACIRSHSPLHHHNYTTMPNPTSDLCRAWPRVADYPALSVDRAGGGNPIYAEDTPN